MQLTTLFTAASLALAPTDSRAPYEEVLKARLDALVERGVPGVSAALVLPGGELVTVTAGHADAASERPMTPADRFLAGSVGKTFVAAAALHLAGDGRLDLDARAADFFDVAGADAWYAALPGSDRFTVRQLLRHQSGLPRYVFDPSLWKSLVAEPDRVWAPRELLGFVANSNALFAPGDGWAYADTNYLLVGMILERVAEQPFYEYAQQQLLEPAELRDTVPSNTRRIDRMSQGYCTALRALGVPERVLRDEQFALNTQFEWCGGGFASTPSDLARWAKRLFSGAAFDADYLDEMLETVAAESMLGPGVRYGLGAIVRETPLGELRGHDGIMACYLTTMGWFPELDLAVAVQVNTDDSSLLAGPLSGVAVDLARIASEATPAKAR